MRMHGPYLSIGQAVAMGLTICAAPSLEDACKRSAALRECTLEHRKRFVRVGEWLMESVPFLPPMLPLFEERPLDLILFANFVDYHGRQGRTADLSTLKGHIHKWIPEVTVKTSDPDTPALTISPLVRGIFDHKRANWGWNSLYTEKLRHGDITNDENGFPSYLYRESAGAWNPAQGMTDLFLGDLLTKGYRGIWTSPDSASREPGMHGAGRASISQANSIDVVRPENIAYIACLLRHILSSEENWSAQDPKVFDGATFFMKIVSLFEIDAFAEPVISHFHQ
ncbi:hypothetical protein BV20DRAFT_958136 [Pilatotrama ljubarskyi]|nr:hypothetical protein BV20DRAFT_958136 [Pilatotrama ljubarskyi]